ncbi:MAG TPA: hypothetical protein DDZ80_11360 [Cyanobacteria bacterium UBA8803]|nr:hypothetical protein [Cyanobacteria bacterium UBA9273]HBL59088.1 hypothetical protein [Cyanobacteria bacterium UBA8803]
MLIKFSTTVAKKLLSKQAFRLKSQIALILLISLLNSGCSEVALRVEQLPSLLPNLSTDANFQINIKPSNRSGVYTVKGTTNLPSSSRIAVAAVRYLRQPNQLYVSPGQKFTFSVLAYQDVEVNNGQWETTLNLWKVAPSGKFQEPWQLDQSKLGLSLEPEPEVTFLATLAPTESLGEVEQQLQKQGIKLASTLIRNTIDGQRYVQVSQALPIPLPTGSTTPPPQRPEDINGGWGPRYILLPEPPNKRQLEMPNQRRTDAPLTPNELMR